MKKILYMAALALLLIGCSSDDSEPVNNPINENPIEEPRLYKLGYQYGNIPLESLTIKTKTGNGPWISHELELRRIPFHYGDSIHISTNTYLPDEENTITMQVHNRFAYFDELNYDFTLTAYGEPIDRKMKLEFMEYEDYPIYE